MIREIPLQEDGRPSAGGRPSSTPSAPLTSRTTGPPYFQQNEQWYQSSRPVLPSPGQGTGDSADPDGQLQAMIARI